MKRSQRIGLAQISHAGDAAEKRFRDATGAKKPHKSVGDAELQDGTVVEVKTASSNTINQVRAVKYLPLVINDRRDGKDDWYVVPAHEVVRLVASKAAKSLARKRTPRGQHTENPYESATLSMLHVEEKPLDTKVGLGTALTDAVAKAVRESARYPAIEKQMRRVLEQSRTLAHESVTATQKTLENCHLTL